MSSRKELAGVRIDICSLREALHKIEHYLASEGLHAVETVSMKTVVTAGEDEQVRQCLEDMDLGGALGADDAVLLIAGQGHVQGSALVPVAVDIHDGQNADLLVGGVEQRIEFIGVVLARQGGGQDGHAGPVAHVVVVLAGVVGHRFGQVVQLALLDGQAQLVDGVEQTVRVDVARLYGSGKNGEAGHFF